jgi:hypothetical protein
MIQRFIFLVLLGFVRVHSSFNNDKESEIIRNKLSDYLTLMSQAVVIPLEDIYLGLIQFDDPVNAARSMFLSFMNKYRSLTNTYIGMESNGKFLGYFSDDVPYGKAFFETIVMVNTTTRLYFYDIKVDGTPVSTYRNRTYEPRARPWYIEAKQKNQITWSSPYLSSTLLQPMITLATPVINNTYADGGESMPHKLLGILAADIALDDINSFLKESFGANRNVFIVDARTGYLIGSSTGSSVSIVDTSTGTKVGSYYHN